MRIASQSQRRRGLSLLEVIVSLAIFLLSLAGLGFLVGTASNHAQEGQFRSQAALLCQSKLAEVAGGAVAAQSQSDVAFDDDPDFRWSLDVESGPVAGLLHITVRVHRTRPNGTELEVSLSQMILDPQIVGSHLDTPQTLAESDTTTSTGSTGSTTTPSSTTPSSTTPTSTAAATPASGTPRSSTGSTPAAATPRASTPAPKASTPAPRSSTPASTPRGTGTAPPTSGTKGR